MSPRGAVTATLSLREPDPVEAAGRMVSEAEAEARERSQRETLAPIFRKAKLTLSTARARVGRATKAYEGYAGNLAVLTATCAELSKLPAPELVEADHSVAASRGWARATLTFSELLGFVEGARASAERSLAVAGANVERARADLAEAEAALQRIAAKLAA